LDAVLLAKALIGYNKKAIFLLHGGLIRKRIGILEKYIPHDLYASHPYLLLDGE
jgi:hypothetical protein